MKHLKCIDLKKCFSSPLFLWCKAALWTHLHATSDCRHCINVLMHYDQKSSKIQALSFTSVFPEILVKIPQFVHNWISCKYLVLSIVLIICCIGVSYNCKGDRMVCKFMRCCNFKSSFSVLGIYSNKLRFISCDVSSSQIKILGVISLISSPTYL